MRLLITRDAIGVVEVRLIRVAATPRYWSESRARTTTRIRYRQMSESKPGTAISLVAKGRLFFHDRARSWTCPY
ncbi:hypothetical protein EMIT0P228_30362 [Pseudomonas brassicacearum]